MSQTKLTKAYYENVTKMTLVYYSYLQRNTHTVNDLSLYTYVCTCARIHTREDRAGKRIERKPGIPLSSIPLRKYEANSLSADAAATQSKPDAPFARCGDAPVRE